MLRRFDLTPARLAFLIALLGFFTAFLLYPLGYVLINAFFVDGRFTLAFFYLVLSDSTQWQIVRNSTELGLVVTAGTTLISIPLAIVMARFEFRGKSILNGLLLVPMVLPPFVGAVGMRQMFARFGSVNLLLMKTGIIDQPIDWFGSGSMLGVVVMEVLHLYPIMYLNMVSALASVDPSMEEAARNVGSHGLSLFRRVTFPLMMPGYFAGASIVFIWAFTDLGTPLIFEYRQVVPVQIFNMISDIHVNPIGYTLVVLMIVMTSGIFYLSKSVMGANRYDMMPRGHVAAAVRIASPIATVAIHMSLLGLATIAMIPHLSVFLTSITDRWFMTVLPESYTFDYYIQVFNHQLTLTSIKNSLVLSALSTVADIAVGITIAYLLVRTRIPGKNILDVLSMMPLAIPGVIIAFGYVSAYSGTILDVRNNPMPLLIFGYAMRRLPFMVRSAYAGFQQTSVVLEEAAHNVGASPMTTLRKITMPLVFAHLLAGGILCFAFAMLEVSDSLILAVEERYYPITKAIYALLGRPDGPFIASALGLLGMVLLAASLVVAGRFLGKRMGELFRG